MSTRGGSPSDLKVVGLMNIQYAIANDIVYILEANPRASRTVPLVSKVTGITDGPHCDSADARQETERDEPPAEDLPPCGHQGIGLSLQHVSRGGPYSGSRDEVNRRGAWIAGTFGMAFFKSQEGAGQRLPTKGTVLLSVNEKDKAEIVDVAKSLQRDGLQAPGDRRGQRSFCPDTGSNPRQSKRSMKEGPTSSTRSTTTGYSLSSTRPSGNTANTTIPTSGRQRSDIKCLTSQRPRRPGRLRKGSGPTCRPGRGRRSSRSRSTTGISGDPAAGVWEGLQEEGDVIRSCLLCEQAGAYSF